MPPPNDMSAFNELKFIIEYSKPLFDCTSAIPKARIDIRFFYKYPIPPVNWDGNMETVNWEEQMMDSTSETAFLHEWSDPTSPVQVKLLAWSQDIIDGLGETLEKDVPDLGDPGGNGIILALDNADSLRGYHEAQALVEEEYEKFLDSPQPPPDAIQREQKTVEEELEELEKAKEGARETAGGTGGLGGNAEKKARDFPPGSSGAAGGGSGDAPPGETSGVFLDNINEDVPEYIAAPCERVLQTKNFPGNAWIVLGRDRPASRTSGYGGAGDTQAASIDLVVGRMASEARGVDDNTEIVLVDPDFKVDAARIYISQKCDIDNYFGLVGGVVGNSATRSSIGLKADGIRLIAREGIKLVTGTDASNSQGASINGSYGIDLIANNDDSDMQPIPLGSNLEEAITKLTEYVESLSGICFGIAKSQLSLSKELMTHRHMGAFFALEGMPSIPLIPTCAMDMYSMAMKMKDVQMLKVNLMKYKMAYLTKFGSGYINSRYNNVN